MDLTGRTALVTGAGHRVGRAIALALGGQRMQVGVHYNASRGGADETVRLVERSGGHAVAFGADLTKPDAIAPLVEAVADHFGSLDVLVNSAAVMVRTPFGEITAAQWDAIMALNTRAPFLLTQAAAPHLRRARGVVVNIADLAAFETWPAYVPHGLSKAGVVYETRALARLLAPEVRVGAVAPGTVLLPDSWGPADAERMRATTPLERNGTPDDVVSAVMYILGADYFTGDTIIVDGGRHIRK